MKNKMRLKGRPVTWHANASWPHSQNRLTLTVRCRPTELEVEADGGKRHIRAVAFLSAPEMHIAEGLPPPDRCVYSVNLTELGCKRDLHETLRSWVNKYWSASLRAHLQCW